MLEQNAGDEWREGEVEGSEDVELGEAAGGNVVACQAVGAWIEEGGSELPQSPSSSHCKSSWYLRGPLGVQRIPIPGPRHCCPDVGLMTLSSLHSTHCRHRLSHDI